MATIEYTQRMPGYKSFCLTLVFILGLCLGPASTIAETSQDALTLAVVQYPSPDPKDALIEKTAEALSIGLADHKLNVINVRFSDLRQLLIQKRIDFFIASPGIYRELIDVGARDLMTVTTSRYGSANRTEASAIISLAATPYDSIESINGKRVAVKSQTGFFSYYVPMREILHAGFKPEGFFSEEIAINVPNYAEQALKLLRSGNVDVVFLKHCLLEDHLTRHPEELGLYRLVVSKEQPGECKRSTRLYPSWVFATAKDLPADVSREILRILLNLRAKASDGSAVYWGNATDYSEVDGLYRDLKIGPFSYLRERTIKQLVTEYRPHILVGFLIVSAAFLHYLSVNWLVRKRTAELEAALEEQKRLKKRMIRLQQRMEKMQRLGVVSSVVSIFAHEMNQPLASAGFYLDSLRNLLNSKALSSEDTERAMQGINKQIRRCSEIIDRVRSFLKAEKRPLIKIDFSSLTDKAVRDFCVTQLVDIQLQTTIKPSLYVLGDRLELELVVVNLLKNAAEALRDIDHACIDVQLTSEKGKAVLRVNDNGRPIDSEMLKELGEALSTTKVSGLGLGLWVVKNIASRHNASVAFDRSGAGGVCAQFSISLIGEHA